MASEVALADAIIDIPRERIQRQDWSLLEDSSTATTDIADDMSDQVPDAAPLASISIARAAAAANDDKHRNKSKRLRTADRVVAGEVDVRAAPITSIAAMTTSTSIISHEYHASEYMLGWYIACNCGKYHIIGVPQGTLMDIELLFPATAQLHPSTTDKVRHEYACIGCGNFIPYATATTERVEAHEVMTPGQHGSVVLFVLLLLIALIIWRIVVESTNG
jgi:hypothetical protein